jgi:hypothetical protein
VRQAAAILQVTFFVENRRSVGCGGVCSAAKADRIPAAGGFSDRMLSCAFPNVAGERSRQIPNPKIPNPKSHDQGPGTEGLWRRDLMSWVLGFGIWDLGFIEELSAV